MEDVMNRGKIQGMPEAQKGSGFTLIELLVVIAIVSILAAILFPVFARARENARRTSCLSNMKQIALGVMQYTQDYDERFPRIGGKAPTTIRPYGWADSLQPYLKSTQVMKCPSVGGAVTVPETLGYVEYFFNIMLNDGYSGVSVASVNFAATTVMLGDGANGNARYSTDGYTSNTGGMSSACRQPDGAGHFAALRITDARHLEGANFAFADGHVKWLKGVIDASERNIMPIYDCGTPHSQAKGYPTFAIN